MSMHNTLELYVLKFIYMNHHYVLSELQDEVYNEL